MKRRSDYYLFKKILDKFQIKKFYHFTDRSNIESIIKNGGLYSWGDCLKNGIYISRPGGSDLSRSLDEKQNLQDYVRISICKRHPMMFYAMNEGRITNPVILEIDTDVLFQEGNIFSNKNAVKTDACKGTDFSYFQNIHFKTALRKSQFDIEEEEKDYYQAEILIKHHIPLHYILNISDFVDSATTYDKVTLRPSYTAQISDENPTGIVFILNQSYPTEKKIFYKGTSKSISQVLCDMINQQLYTLLTQNTSGDTIHNRYQVSVIGYGDYCYSCFKGNLSYKDFVDLKELKENPIEIKKTIIEKKTRRGMVQIESEMPIWIKPRNGGNAYLFTALEHTKNMLERWTSLHPNSFPPIVIHISCFGYNGRDDSFIIQQANEIKSLYTKDGNVLFANLIFSFKNEAPDEPIYFPNSLVEMGNSVFGEMYFLMSSQLPMLFNNNIKVFRNDTNIKVFHTALAFNTSINDIPKFLQSLIYT